MSVNGNFKELSSSTQKEASEDKNAPVASKSLPEKNIPKNAGEAEVNNGKEKSVHHPTAVSEDKSDMITTSKKEKEIKPAVAIRSQPINDVEKRQQVSANNTASTPADLSKDWDMDDDDADVEEDPEESNNVSEKDATKDV